MARWRAVGFLSLATLWSSVVAAQVPVGPEFQVNTYTPGDQHSVAKAAAAGGQMMDVWVRPGDGSGSGIFGRVYDSAGNPLGPEFLVNSHTLSAQHQPAVTGDAAGRFVVVWGSVRGANAYDVMGQRFDSVGGKLGTEFQANSFTVGDQGAYSVDVAAAPGGEFVVVWTSYYQDGYANGVFGQRFNPTGIRLGTEFQVNSYTAGDEGWAQNHGAVAVARAPGNDFVVVWTGGYDQDGSAQGIFGRYFDFAGVPTPEFQVNSYITGAQGYYGGPDVAALGAGGFVVTWDSYAQDGEDYGIFARSLTPIGVPIGDEFQVNSFTAGSQGYGGPAVAADAAGSFIVAWTSAVLSTTEVRAQRFLSDGSPIGNEFQVNTYTTGLQWMPDVAADWSGCVQIGWRVGARMSPGGCLVDTDCPKFPFETCVAGVCERVDQQDGDEGAIFAQRYCRAPALNHYKCYNVKDLRRPRFTPLTGVSLADQFISESVDVRKVAQLCTPVDKNGEGIADPGLHLCCYDLARTLKLATKPIVEVGSQFQSSRLQPIKGQTLCTPCQKVHLP